MVAVGVAGLLLALGVVIGLISGRRALGWHRSELVVGHQQVMLGSELHLVVRRRPRRQRDLPRAAVEARLRCRERATFSAGTDTRTEVTDLVEVSATATGEGTPRGFEAELVLRIPVDAGAPSIHLPRNQVVWTISVDTPDPALPGPSDEFDLRVLPAIDPCLRPEPEPPVEMHPARVAHQGLALSVDTAMAEVGGSFTGEISFRPLPDDDDLRAVRVELYHRTEGRGTAQRRTVSVVEHQLERATSLSDRFLLPVPSDGPVSYDGRSIRVIWEVAAIVDRPRQKDRSVVAGVVVVPAGGSGLYRAPHPGPQLDEGGQPPRSGPGDPPPT